MVFCNEFMRGNIIYDKKVTILILIDGFLQYKEKDIMVKTYKGHNPYFNRWFSAI